jgi:hypothetical protein
MFIPRFPDFETVLALCRPLNVERAGVSICSFLDLAICSQGAITSHGDNQERVPHPVGIEKASDGY